MIYEDLKGKRVLVTGSSSGIGAAKAEMFARQTPLGRNGTAADVAATVLFLASNATAFITGEYIAVNGGNYMRV